MARTRGRTILGGSGAGPSNRTATAGSPRATASSPMSMGELVKHIERRSQDLSRNYNKGGQMPGSLNGNLVKAGAKFAERAILGRTFSRAYTGVQYGSYIGRAILRASKIKPGRVATWFKVYQKFKFTMPPSYNVVLACGGTPTYLTGAATFAACGGVAVVSDNAINASLTGSIISSYEYVGPYATPNFHTARKGTRWLRPGGVTDRPVIHRTAGQYFMPGEQFEYQIPHQWPGSWARAFDRPASEFSTPGDTEQFGGSDAPWKNPTARQIARGAGIMTRGWPYGTFGPSTQTLTPPKTGASAGTAPASKPGTPTKPSNPSKPGTGTGTATGTGTDNPAKPGEQPTTKPQTDKPSPPPITKPGVPPSRPPGKRTKEVKFGGKPILVRVLRAVLGVTEVIDTLDALVDAIPDDKQKKCRRLARDRYWKAKNSGSQVGSLNWQMTPQEKIICVGANLDTLDLNQIYYNIIKNELEDMWAGWQYGAIDKQLQISRPLGGATSTKNPFDHLPAQLPAWDDPWWDEVALYLREEGL